MTKSCLTLFRHLLQCNSVQLFYNLNIFVFMSNFSSVSQLVSCLSTRNGCSEGDVSLSVTNLFSFMYSLWRANMTVVDDDGGANYENMYNALVCGKDQEELGVLEIFV